VNKLSNKIRIMIFASLLFLGVGAGTSHAQVVDDPILKACEETADKAKRLEIENASLKAQLDIANQRLANKDEQIANKNEQIAFYKEKDKNNSQIDRTTELMVQNLRQQIADDRLRINDLENENKGLRSSRRTWTLVGVGAGFGTGYYLGNKNR
jgi:predicted RNase H-like nuclease (RuvC/YqgF family)